MNLAHFYLWKDARIWAYWSYSFDMLLDYQGPVFYFSPSWIPQGEPSGGVCVCVCVCVAAVVHGLLATTSIVYWYGRGRSLYTHCYNKVPRLGGLNNRKFIASQFWRLEVKKIKVREVLILPEGWVEKVCSRLFSLVGKRPSFPCVSSHPFPSLPISVSNFPLLIKTQSYWATAHP